MKAELAEQLANEIKELEIDITFEGATLLTTTTLRVMERHLKERTLLNKAKFLSYTVEIVESLLKEMR